MQKKTTTKRQTKVDAKNKGKWTGVWLQQLEHTITVIEMAFLISTISKCIKHLLPINSVPTY